MPDVLILHGYSARNRGDGLLVDEALELIRDSLGHGIEVTLCASHPESFSHLKGVKVVDSGVGKRGYNREYIRTLGRIRKFNLVVGVGGGYLRAGYPLELIKTLLIHGPQLLAAAFRGKSVVYLPQSIGPLRYGTRAVANMALRRLDTVMLRDDKSFGEIRGRGIMRIPDVAALSVAQPDWKPTPDPTPILSVRELRGKIPNPVRELAYSLGSFDGYVQSSTAGNDDESAMFELRPVRVLTEEEFSDAATRPRVVVAMRLHGALMALRAGHFVIHLAYERKGFGAFSDLGLGQFVHNTRRFDPELVERQVKTLLTDSGARESYAKQIQATLAERGISRDQILSSLEKAAV